MTTKAVDYYVSAVRYNAGNVHIDQVKVYTTDTVTNNLVGPTTMTRAEVVKQIGQGKLFMTMTKGKDNKWTRGAALQIQSVATQYIKTVADAKTSDNLENLPAF